MHGMIIETGRREEMVDITDMVRDVIGKSGKKDGLCIAFSPHTTAALTINENADDDVKTDMVRFLGKLIPESEEFRHSEGNSDAHIKASLVGNSVAIIVENGKMVLGKWQGIMLAEFDGPRRRNVYVKII